MPGVCLEMTVGSELPEDFWTDAGVAVRPGFLRRMSSWADIY